MQVKCNQHTGRLWVFVTCKLSRAVELIVKLGEISVALAQSRAHTARVETGMEVRLGLREVGVAIISWPKNQSNLKQGLLTNEA